MSIRYVFFLMNRFAIKNLQLNIIVYTLDINYVHFLKNKYSFQENLKRQQPTDTVGFYHPLNVGILCGPQNNNPS